MNDLVSFANEAGLQIRAALIDGEPALCAKDVALALGYANPSAAITQHCKGVVIHYPLETAGGVQEARFIKEPDFYRLALRSNTPEAEAFQDWVCEEVLPALRKTGRYAPPAITEGQIIIDKNSIIATQSRMIELLEEELRNVKSRENREVREAIPKDVEDEICRLARQGMRNIEIADRVGRKPATICTVLRRNKI